MDSLTSSVLIGLALLLLLGLSIGLQVFRTRRSLLGHVVAILGNLKHNIQLCENFSYHYGIGRLKADAWEKYREKVGFLPQELLNDLSKVFDLVMEINVNIDAATRFKTDSYMAAIEIDKLRGPLVSCHEQLQAWIYANMHNPDYLPKKRSLFHR